MYKENMKWKVCKDSKAKPYRKRWSNGITNGDVLDLHLDTHLQMVHGIEFVSMDFHHKHVHQR